MYSYSEQAESVKKTNTSGALPPATKLLPSMSQNNNASLTGWTPLISRTFSNDMISYNSTPSSKMLPSMYKQNNTGSASGHNAVNASDYDYPSLNLTPFLTHNLNLMNNPSSAGNLSNNISFTPFYDKSMHLADFFMESPIRQTPLKVETITPSKFSMQLAPVASSTTLDAKLDSALDSTMQSAMSLKRSITQIDTPARHPYKKYNVSTEKEEKQSDSEEDNGDDKENEGSRGNRLVDNFVTPSKNKVLNKVSGNLLNKTPSRVVNVVKSKNLYQTPAKPSLVSSPSTVIMSSATTSPDNEVIKQSPASPTPLKDKIEVADPVMGIFSERKAAQEPKPQRKPRKQSSGMNRFQIVFTDVHTLMNSRKKKVSGNASSSRNEKNEKKKPQPKLTKQELRSPPTYPQQHPQAYTSFHQTLSSLSASQDFNSTINTSREFSVVGNSSTVNTTSSNLNVASDQSSFEIMHGGLMSTPNGKFLLDHLFDRGSPQAVNQMTSSLNQIHMDVKANEYMRNEGLQHMPPPQKFITLQQAAQQALRHDTNQSIVMNMTMSTPQHKNIVSGPHGTYAREDLSPSDKDSMAYMYQHLHQFHHMNSPGNTNLLNVHSQPQVLQDQHQSKLQDKQVQQEVQGRPTTSGRKKRLNRNAK